MTSQSYTKQYRWTSGYVNRPFESLLSNTPGGAKRVAQGAFSNAGSMRSHVLTAKSLVAEMADDFIDNAYREFEIFEREYQKRKHARRLKFPPLPPFTDYLDL